MIIRNNAITSFRQVINKLEPLSTVSKLDTDDDSLDEKYKEFKDAINNNEFSDEYNLTNSDIEKLKTDDVTAMIPTLLDILFDNDVLIDPDCEMKDIYDIFGKLYEQYLGRELVVAEKAVLSSAIKIMIWKVYGKTFHLICQYRYSYTARVAERRKLYGQGKIDEANNLKAKYLIGCHDIPNKSLTSYPLISSNMLAKDVDYDLIVYDTYDYLDKLIGFNYAISFMRYFINTNEKHKIKSIEASKIFQIWNR